MLLGPIFPSLDQMAFPSTMERPVALQFDDADLQAPLIKIRAADVTTALASGISSIFSQITIFLPCAPPNLTTPRLFELVFILGLYALIFNLHVHPTVSLYNTHQKVSRQRFLANLTLGIHIVGGMFEMLRWQLRACWTAAPIPDDLDFFLAILQAATSLRLAKYMRRGQPLMTRPTFQAGPLFRLAISAAAWWMESGVLHRSSVATLNGFIYTRVAVAGLGPLMVSKFGDKPRYPEVYNLATFVGVVIAVSDVEIPHATKMYAILVVLVAALNRWVTSQLGRKDIWVPKKVILNILVTFGFAELETIHDIAASGRAAPSDDRFVLQAFLAPKDDMITTDLNLTKQVEF